MYQIRPLDFVARGHVPNSSFEFGTCPRNLYNRALTPADVTALYNNGGPTIIRNAHIGRGVIR